MNTFGKNCDKNDPTYIYPRSGEYLMILGIENSNNLNVLVLIFDV